MGFKERDFCTTDFVQYVAATASQKQGVAKGGGRMALAIYKTKTWVPRGGGTAKITIGFLDGSASRKSQVKKIAHQWELVCPKIKFVWGKPDVSDVRITFKEAKKWSSRVGTDAKSVKDKTLPTMKLGWTPKTTLRMFKRHVLHEFGHMLGAKHEQSSPNFPYKWDKKAVKSYHEKLFRKQYPQWSTAQINKRVDDFTRVNIYPRYTNQQVNASQFDPDSIMQYSIPGNWMISPSGKKVPSIRSKNILSKNDKKWMSDTYCQKKPKPPKPKPIPCIPLCPQPNPPRPYIPPRPAPTNNLCGNPSCGQTFICTADYNRCVQAMGYPGVTSGGGGGGGGWQGWYGCYRPC